MVRDQASAALVKDNDLLATRVDQKTGAAQSLTTRSANMLDFSIENVLRDWTRDAPRA